MARITNRLNRLRHHHRHSYLFASPLRLHAFSSAPVPLDLDILEECLDRKAMYLSKKKQSAEQSRQWNPVFVGKYTKKMEQCHSGQDILRALKEIESEHGAICNVTQYINAIRKAAALREYATCFEIFETAKTLQSVDIQLYTLMIWVCSQLRTAVSLSKGIELYIELQEVYHFVPSIAVYNQLLSLCVKTMEYGKGKYIWKELSEHTQSQSLPQRMSADVVDTRMPNISTYNILMELYCKCGEMHHAVEIFEGLFVGKYGDLKPNYVIYSTLLAAFAKHKQVETAQQLFAKCMHTLYVSSEEHNQQFKRPILILVQCLLDSYANVGNVDECVLLLQNMMDKTHAVYDWTFMPDPNAQVFTCVLKALTRYKAPENAAIREQIKIDGDTCWNIAEWSLQCMDALNIAKDAVVYGNLFHLCGDLYGNVDLERALRYYEEMKAHHVRPAQLQMFNLLKTGEQHHHHLKTDNEQRITFVKYVLSEMQQQKITPSVQMKKLVNKMMGTYHDQLRTENIK